MNANQKHPGYKEWQTRCEIKIGNQGLLLLIKDHVDLTVKHYIVNSKVPLLLMVSQFW